MDTAHRADVAHLAHALSGRARRTGDAELTETARTITAIEDDLEEALAEARRYQRHHGIVLDY